MPGWPPRSAAVKTSDGPALQARQRMRRLRLTGAWLAALLALNGLPAPSALGETVQPQEYMLLNSRFGELCSMCEAMVLCTEHGPDGSPQPPATLLHFQTKTFWGQVRTIWEYLIRWVAPVSGNTRPVYLYVEQADSSGRLASDAHVLSADFSLDPPLIRLDDRQIERWSGQWLDAGGEVVGQCRRLPLRETLEVIKAGESSDGVTVNALAAVEPS